MIRVVSLALSAAFICFAEAANAQEQADTAGRTGLVEGSVTTTELGHRTYMLSNGISGNVTVAVGDDGIIMVDGQHAPMHDKLKAAIAAVSPQPIKYLVNTHHHGDHTGGNARSPRTAPPSSRTSTCASGSRPAPPATLTGAQDAAGRRPRRCRSKTYDGDSGSRSKSRAASAKLKHPANAHTDGDTYVYFADANVLSTGDTFNNGR